MSKVKDVILLFSAIMLSQLVTADMITIAGSGSASGFQNIGSGGFDAQPASVPVAGPTTDDFGTAFGTYTNAGRGVYIDFGEDWDQITIQEVLFGLKLNGTDPTGTPASYWSPLGTVASAEADGVAAPDFFFNWTGDTGEKSWQTTWTGTETVKNRYYVQVYDGTQVASNRPQEIVFAGSIPEPSTLIISLMAVGFLLIFRSRK